MLVTEPLTEPLNEQSKNSKNTLNYIAEKLILCYFEYNEIFINHWHIKSYSEKVNHLSYKFVVVEYPLIDKVGGKTYTDKYAGLGIRDEDNGIIYPLPITKFLEEGYRNQRISTQKNAAEAIKRFLNYCREAIIESEFDQDFQDFSILKEQGLQGLKLVHGSFYITHLQEIFGDLKM